MKRIDVNMADTNPEDAERFVRLLTESQPRLYSYVRTLILNHVHASDVLQNTNVILWQRMSQFHLGTNFLAWARKIAYFEVLAYYRDKKRENLVFDIGLVEMLAEQSATETNDNSLQDAPTREMALRKCLEKLTQKSRDLLQQRYDSSLSVQAIAEQQNRTVGAVSQALYRIRHQLMTCIQKNIRLMPCQALILGYLFS